MKIKYALMSSNANPEYLDFWPVAAKAWLDLGITPVLFYIPDHAEDAPVVPTDVPGGEVHTITHLPDVNTALQSSMLRFWGSCYYPDDIVIVSDIDMLPLSKAFFVDQLSGINNDRYVHLRCVRNEYETVNLYNLPTTRKEKVTEITGMQYLNACYHIAQGDLMGAVWGWSSDWETSCRKTIPYHHYVRIGHNEYSFHAKAGFHVSGDELYSSMRIAMFPHREVFHYVTHTQEKFAMLFRNYWKYDIKKLQADYYSAAHLPRPYSRYRKAVDYINKGKTMSPIYNFCFTIMEKSSGGLPLFSAPSNRRKARLSFVLLWPQHITLKILNRLTGQWQIGLLRMYSGALLSQIKKTEK